MLIALYPISIIWTPFGKKTRGKITISVAVTITFICMLIYANSNADNEDIIDSMMTRNYEYMQCIDNAEDEDKISRCILNNIDELSEIYLD